MDIGKRIRQLRIQNDLTLEELASRTELTKGFLSQLERNLSSPSIQTLEDITEALGTTMAKFFAEDTAEQIVFTPEDAFIDERDRHTVHWIVPNAQKNEMEPILVELEPGGKSEVIDPHNGEEFGYVLSGKVTLFRDGTKKGVVVRKGENFYISGKYAHWLENNGTHSASVLWISTPPIF
ncbi:MAG: helix-turn-helix transcriptional regulator [Solobacterium sp.]|nr:helix-turn-helix transcriptional regulator [Solobacterium sp.]